MNAEPPRSADAGSALNETSADGAARGGGAAISAADLARAALQERLREVRARLREIRRGDHEPETIHQLRVWSRRAEAALSVFAAFAPRRRAKWLRGKLKSIRRAAGDARDADVLFSRWTKKAGDSPDAGWKRLLAQVERERKSTRKDVSRLARKLGQKDFGPRTRAFLKRVRERRAEALESASEAGATAFAHRAIAAASKEFWKAEPLVLKHLDELHAFRIEGKKLRYAIEACREALPAATVATCLDELTALQDRLGKLNDRASACSQLERWQVEAKHPAAVERLGFLLDAEQIELQARIAGLADWWNGERRTSLRERLFEVGSPRPLRDWSEGESAEPGDDAASAKSPEEPPEQSDDASQASASD